MLEAVIPLIVLISLVLLFGLYTIIFKSILSDKLPKENRKKVKIWAIGLAMLVQLAFLAFISFILKLDTTLFTLLEPNFSGKSFLLVLGGLFLIYKSTKEIYQKTKIVGENETTLPKKASIKKLLGEITLLYLAFSVDSIITAVCRINEPWIMFIAIIVTVIIMHLASKSISDFTSKQSSFKVVTLYFLTIIGVLLIAEGFQFKIPKGCIYFSMTFAYLIHVIQIKTIKPNSKFSQYA